MFFFSFLVVTLQNRMLLKYKANLKRGCWETRFRRSYKRNWCLKVMSVFRQFNRLFVKCLLDVIFNTPHCYCSQYFHSKMTVSLKYQEFSSHNRHNTNHQFVVLHFFFCTMQILHTTATSGLTRPISNTRVNKTTILRSPGKT